MEDKNIGRTFGVTDDDLIETLGLSPGLKGKPGINDAAMEAVRNQIKTNLMSQGLTEEMAEREASMIQKENMRK